MHIPPRVACVVAILLPAAPAFGQTYDLVFNDPVQQTNATHAVLGDYYTGTTFDFLNVAPDSGQWVDMRLTITDITTPRYGYMGSVPDYSGTPGVSGGDLGLVYSYQGGSGGAGNFGPGSATYNLEFFQGGSNFSNPFAIPDFRIMLYEVDGEPTQDEGVMVFANDGLVSYQLPTSTQISATDQGGGQLLFSAPGIDTPFTDPSAAFLLRYQNTSAISLQVIANTYSGSPNNNGVLVAIDGDLSTILGGSLSAPVFVPEPSVAGLAVLTAAGALFRRRRQRP
ncbi:PEP-CTERM sorting domain-containing protein [Haloferula sp. BvORR071]|uniref:PEP-CTERM sorting domain-containing protein n=1 Tax=Haloferula sp. BvORR071 TaxID=1396141 RepID=UPI000552F088|nr:PEP-CTERM sorting domain-containing protein [Haloferula sp. BvORR071]